MPTTTEDQDKQNAEISQVPCWGCQAKSLRRLGKRPGKPSFRATVTHHDGSICIKALLCHDCAVKLNEDVYLKDMPCTPHKQEVDVDMGAL